MEGRFHIGEWTVEPQLNSLANSDCTLHIEPKAMQVLVSLSEHAGEVVSKEKLIRVVWADTFVGDDVLTRTISDLRKAFGDNPKEPRFIQTIPKSGYRLLVPVIYEPVTQETMAKVGTAFAEATPEARPGRWWRSRQILAVCLLVIGVAAVAFYAWVPSKPKRTEAGAVKSIAVLPFKPLVADNRDEALELGMADTLINKLGSLREVIVRPISSVRKYTALDRDPVAIGREQGVDAVLDASLQTAGERVRVSARLLRVSDGATLWADKCDEQQCANLFQMQDAIVEKVADSLALRLTDEDRKALAKRYTENTEAYRLYLLGRYYFGKLTEEGYKKSIEYFNQALEIDPNYALAYCGLADVYSGLTMDSLIMPKEGLQKAKEAVARALEIDDALAEAHAALGNIKWSVDHDWSGAEAEYKRAIELDPSQQNNFGLIILLSHTGRQEEAIARWKRYLELSPTDRMANKGLAESFYFARQYDQCIEQCRNMLDMDSRDAGVHFNLGLCYEQKGMYQEAIAEMQKAITLVGSDPQGIAGLGHVYAVSGNRGKAEEMLKEVKERSKQTYVQPYLMALIYTGLGDKDRAFEWLKKASEGWSIFNAAYLNVDPRLDSLRSDPRFTDVLRRLRLAP